MIHRRAVLGGAAALAAGAATFGLSRRPAALDALPSVFTGDALFADVVAYDAIGVHQTATPSDRSTVCWMADHLPTCGFSVRTPSFTVRQFYPETCTLLVGERSIPAAPQWPAYFLDAPVEAPLVEQGEGAEVVGAIAIVRFRYEPRATITLPDYHQAIEAAARGGARAVVAITEGPTGGIIHMNAPGRLSRLPLPVVLVGPDDTDALRDAASARAMCRLDLRGRVNPSARAFNVIGTLDRGAEWIVISTPISGWTRCAGERGPGVALWRALAAWAGVQGRSNFLFVATSGHELGHAGFDAVLADVERLVPRSRCKLWLHLGANIAVRSFVNDADGFRLGDDVYGRRWLVATSSLLPELSWCFAGEPGLTPVPAIESRVAGEIGSVLRAGYRPAAGLFGSAPFHHVADDRPAATSADLLGAVAAPILRFVADVDRS